MRKVITLSLVMVMTLAFGGCNLASQSKDTVNNASPTIDSSASPNTIVIKDFSFNPTTLTVKKGTTITWINNDSVPHQIKSSSFNSSELTKGQSYSFTFSKVGTFDYFCAIHPSMTGKIAVE